MDEGDIAKGARGILAGLGGILIVIAFISIFSIIAFLIIEGTAWASTKLLPWFSILTWIALFIVLFIILPLAIPKPTRGFAAVSLFIASYIFGVTLWMEGFLFTLVIWGMGAVFIGLFLGIVGVVPIAMLATLIKGMWMPLIEMVVLLIMTFGSRIGAVALAESLE
ncbi:MAG: hypothetical protein P8Y64_13730 [Gammaproteobacteria bacterium]